MTSGDRKRILVTGAAGSIGSRVIKQLCAKLDQYDVIALDLKNRKAARKLSAYKKQIQVVYGDIRDAECIAKVCTNIDVAIHLAAILPPKADKDWDETFNINVEGTAKVIHELEHQSPKAFLLFSSSIAVYGDRLANPWIRASDPLSPGYGHFYANSKIKAEDVVKNSKLDWSILRLTAIMGDHKISKLMFHQPLNTSLEIATLDDTACALVNAIEHLPELSRKTYNLGGGDLCRIQYDEFLDRSFEIAGLGKADFPNKAFAEHNFHCGFYEDGDDLERILKFRYDTLEDYFNSERKKFGPIKTFLASIFKNQIKWQLLQLSEPYRAFKENNTEMIKRFFKIKKENQPTLNS